MHNVIRVPLLALAIALPALAQTTDPAIDQAKLLFAQNDYDKAADVLEKAVEAKPNDANRHFWLGQAYGSLAQKANILRQASLASKTRSEFERAVQLDP